jgi:hypothetical protein
VRAGERIWAAAGFAEHGESAGAELLGKGPDVLRVVEQRAPGLR